MGNTLIIEEDVFTIEGNSIKVKKTDLSTGFKTIPESQGDTVIIEQKPDSCFLDPDGAGAKRLKQIGVSDSEGQKVINDLNNIIKEVDWSVAWINNAKPKMWLFFCLILNFLGVCLGVCIAIKKNNAIKKKRDDLMTKAKEYARDFNINSREFELKIPHRFTEYIEIVVKPEAMGAAMGMNMNIMSGMPQQYSKFDPNGMAMPNMGSENVGYNQYMYAPQAGGQQNNFYYNDAQQQQMMNQQQPTQDVNVNFNINLNKV